jgi:hypothetical protein
MAIGAVVVEVQTEEELAVQAACGWEIREVIRSAEKKTNRKNEESSPVESRAREHPSFSFFSNSYSVPRTNLIKLAPPHRTTGRHGKKAAAHSGLLALSNPKKNAGEGVPRCATPLPLRGALEMMPKPPPNFLKTTSKPQKIVWLPKELGPT